MTTLLTKAFNKAAELSRSAQNEFAEQLLEDITSELRFDATFAKSQDKLAHLADEALAEHKHGHTKRGGFGGK